MNQLMEKLIEHFSVDEEHLPESPYERFATVILESGHGLDGASISTWQTREEAFQHMGDSILDGWAPEGVYDLHTGEKIELHISTPVVTPSEDQGVTENPLENVGSVAQRVANVVVRFMHDEDLAVNGFDSRNRDRLAAEIERVLGLTALRAEIKSALEGDSNDLEHDALVSVADALGVGWEVPA